MHMSFKNLHVTYKIFEKFKYIQPKFIIIQKYLNLNKLFFIQVEKNLSNNANVCKYLLKKTYKFSKNYNKIYENLQVTYKIFEKIYLHSSEIYKYTQITKKNYKTYLITWIVPFIYSTNLQTILKILCVTCLIFIYFIII